MVSSFTDFVHVSFGSVGFNSVNTLSGSFGNSGSVVPDFGGFEISNVSEGGGGGSGSGGERDLSL